MVFHTIITFNRARETRASIAVWTMRSVIARLMQFNANKIFCHVNHPFLVYWMLFQKSVPPDLVKQIGSAILRFLSGRNCASSNELSDVKSRSRSPPVDDVCRFTLYRFIPIGVTVPRLPS